MDLKNNRPSAIFLLVVGQIFTLLSCDSGDRRSQPEEKSLPATTISNEDLVSRGKYLVNAIGCDDCHSPKRMGSQGPEIIAEKRFGGFPSGTQIPKVENAKGQWILFMPDLTASVGPWGMSFSANISSDETGIGNWTEAQFIRAIREGKYKGLPDSRPLLPPMPWPSYGQLNDEDLSAIFAFLKSTRPVRNVVPAPIPPDKL